MLARWPWALAGTLAALRDWMTGSFVDFRVTPKGTSEVDPLPFRVLVPYAIIALGSVFAVLLVSDAGESLEVLALGAKHVRLFEERYSAAGAGVGGQSLRITTFSPHWRSDTSANISED